MIVRALDERGQNAELMYFWLGMRDTVRAQKHVEVLRGQRLRR